jgi:mannosyl-3-phosphoglycerate phosphatase family protein
MRTKAIKKILVFTDLDGSLLNHYNYSWKDAVPALTRLYKNSYPVIFTSSKTSAEIQQIRQEMGNIHPCISENGAVVNIPCAYFEAGLCDENESNSDSYLFAKPYEEIIAVLAALRDEYQFVFRGFNDIQLDELVALTELNEEQTKLSKQQKAYIYSQNHMKRSLLCWQHCVMNTSLYFVVLMISSWMSSSH